MAVCYTVEESAQHTCSMCNILHKSAMCKVWHLNITLRFISDENPIKEQSSISSKKRSTKQNSVQNVIAMYNYVIGVTGNVLTQKETLAINSKNFKGLGQFAGMSIGR